MRVAAEGREKMRSEKGRMRINSARIEREGGQTRWYVDGKGGASKRV